MAAIKGQEISVAAPPRGPARALVMHTNQRQEHPNKFAEKHLLKPLYTLPLLACLISGCANPIEEWAKQQGGSITSRKAAGPPNADPNSCYGRESAPAEINAREELIVVQPAEVTAGGSVEKPPLVKVETVDSEASQTEELWFEIPCEIDAEKPVFIASLQRALAARGLYDGPVNGLYDQNTQKAVRAYQAPQGLDSGILSLVAAQQMGLVAQ